jgi:hypothetical protein
MQLLKAIHVGKSRQQTQKPKLTKEYVFDNARKDKEVRVVTSGIFYCRNSTEIKVVARFKLHRGLTVTCSEIGNKNIPPIR